MDIKKKPWGEETLIELTENYAVKRLYIKSGEQTSYQYHREKEETFIVIGGEGIVHIEGEDHIIKSGDVLTIHPKKKHTTIAIKNLSIIEISSPEINDVVRLSDKYGRVTKSMIQK